jgi:hypothetical protein
MIVTEAQAKQLMCPIPTGWENCKASGCMWWAWRAPLTRKVRKHINQTQVGEPHRMAGLPDGWVWVPFNPEEPEISAHWREDDASYNERRLGCCGGASNPGATLP